MTPDELQFHYLQNPAMAYAPNSSPTSKDIEYIGGSNVMTSIKEYAERRNGFSPYIADSSNFTFSGSIARFFTWRRWTGAAVTLSGAYFVMFNEINATSSKVYKYRIGSDVYPTAVLTDATSVFPFDFVVSNNYLFFGNGNVMKKYDGSNVTNWGIAASSTKITTTNTAGALSPVIGYQWQFAFGSSVSTHMSSPNPASSTTGALSLQQFNFGGITTTDAQVDQVRVFRTVDGGSIYFELPNSPVTYAAWLTTGITDNNLDITLSTAVAPLPNQNNPPTPSQGCVWFANRVWTFFDDTMYYSDFEELVRGIEEESFSSVNQRFIGREITGLVVAGTFLLIYTADAIYRIYGDSLANFNFDTLAIGKGALSRTVLCSFRMMVAWLDSSNCIFVTDGSTIADKDISNPIRTDLTGVIPANCMIAYHSTGNTHWLIFMDGTADTGFLRVFDLDTAQWMVPWPINSLSAIYSGQVAPATYRLFLGKNKKPLIQDTGYQDDGTPYTASATTNLFDLCTAVTRTGTYVNPAAYGVLNHIAVETATVLPSTVAYLADEDPAGATYTAAPTPGIAPPNRTQGVNLVETWFPLLGDPNNRGARRVSIQLSWSAANTNFKLYGVVLGYSAVDA